MSEVIIDALKTIAPPIGWGSLGAVLGILVVYRLDLGKSQFSSERATSGASAPILSRLSRMPFLSVDRLTSRSLLGGIGIVRR